MKYDPRKLNVAFEKYMREVMSDVAVNSLEWWVAKKGFLGGVGAGITIPGEEYQGIGEAMFSLYEECDVFSVLAREVSPEHLSVGPDGIPTITETGMIQLATAMEQASPERAAEIRQVRYALQSILKKLREKNK